MTMKCPICDATVADYHGPLKVGGTVYCVNGHALRTVMGGFENADPGGSGEAMPSPKQESERIRAARIIRSELGKSNEWRSLVNPLLERIAARVLSDEP